MDNAPRVTGRLPSTMALALAAVGPGWFTSIMGTGILAICVTISPIRIPLSATIGRSLWSADTVLFGLFAGLLMAALAFRSRAVAATFHDPAKAQLWGAPPMACFTIAVGFLKIGTSILPAQLCVSAAQTLFIIGVVGSIVIALTVPYLMFTTHVLSSRHMAGNWLLPVVPPIVASVPAALLSATWPAPIRGDMLALAYGLLGIGVILAAIVIVVLYSRLVYHKVPDGALVTTTWLVIGPLGQSIAGIIALGSAARIVWPTIGGALFTVGIAYGLIVWGFALYWLAMAIALTLRARRAALPFTLGWWAFTFPVGVLTAGTDALWAATRADMFALTALSLTALLAALWTLVATLTIRSATGSFSAQMQSFGRAKPRAASSPA